MLIAFIVVASVFAYTVLTAGIFASQNSNAAINEVRSSATINGNTIAHKGSVDAGVRATMTIEVALNGIPLDVTSS